MLTDKSLRRLILQALYDKDVCTAEAFIDALIDARGVCSRMQLLTVIGTLLHCGYIVCGEHQTTYTIMPNGKYMLTKLKEAEQEAEQLTAAPPTEPVQMNYEYSSSLVQIRKRFFTLAPTCQAPLTMLSLKHGRGRIMPSFIAQKLLEKQ